MTNINDLGLPQGLPEMLGKYHSAVNSFTGQWAQYHPDCGCATCQQLRAFSNSAQEPNGYTAKALNSIYAAPERPREMTAEDLGLLTRLCRLGQEIDAPDAPYSFWLGADA